MNQTGVARSQHATPCTFPGLSLDLLTAHSDSIEARCHSTLNVLALQCALLNEVGRLACQLFHRNQSVVKNRQVIGTRQHGLVVQMSTHDPFYLVRHDIQEAVADLQQKMARFHGLQPSNPERQLISRQVKDGCEGLLWQVRTAACEHAANMPTCTLSPVAIP